MTEAYHVDSEAPTCYKPSEVSTVSDTPIALNLNKSQAAEPAAAPVTVTISAANAEAFNALVEKSKKGDHNAHWQLNMLLRKELGLPELTHDEALLTHFGPIARETFKDLKRDLGARSYHTLVLAGLHLMSIYERYLFRNDRAHMRIVDNRNGYNYDFDLKAAISRYLAGR